MDTMRTLILNDNRTLGYQYYGRSDGLPLYFFHGFPGSRLQAELIHEQAAVAGVCLIAPDRPGFGHSTFAPDRTLLSWANDVTQLADALGHQRFGVLGVSCGGLYALACARQLAWRLSYVGLMAGISPLDVPSIQREQMLILRLMFFLARIHPLLVSPFLFMDRLMLRGDPDRAVRTLARILSLPDQTLIASNELVRKRFSASLAEAYVQGLSGAIHEVQLIAGSQGFPLKHINGPVHLYQSGQDRHVPPRMAKYLAARIPDARLHMYPDEGHLSVLIHRFGDCLRDFLAADAVGPTDFPISLPLTDQEKTMQTDVLIVGAGPTGLALATTLKRAGIDCMIVDRLNAGQNTSRAAVIHAHTLEVLEALGVSEQLGDEGLKLTRFAIRDRDRVLVKLRFDQLPTHFAHLLMLPQDRTEAILTDALVEAGGVVRRGCTVETVMEVPDGVTAIITSNDGRETIHARYVVGADGMQSRVRENAGIDFAGARYEESFILADITMSWVLGREEVSLFFSPAGLVVVAPLPAMDRYRVVATLEDAPEHPSIADVQALLDTRGPKGGAASVSQVLWSSRFCLHHRVANQYRCGRFLLVGDAAHVHSPAGGQGMNTGLVDAYVLGRLLADVVSGCRDDSHLDRYETLRRPAAQQVLALAGRLTRLATVRSVPGRVLRNFALWAINQLPLARRQLEMNLSGLSRRAAAALESDRPPSTTAIKVASNEVGARSIA